MDSSARPVIFEYHSIPEFVSDTLRHLRANEPGYSLRRATIKTPGCSAPLVSQVAAGRRVVTRDRVSDLAHILRLTPQESRYLDRWVAGARTVGRRRQGAQRSSCEEGGGPLGTLLRPALPHRPYQRVRDNSVLRHWLNLIVLEAARLRGFQGSPMRVHRMLHGMASLREVAASLRRLIRGGYLVSGDQGGWIPARDVTYTTEDVPDSRLRMFAKKSFELARRAVDTYPPTRRHNDGYILTLDDQNVAKLKALLSSFTDKVEQFEREHAPQTEGLYQVLITLSPLGHCLRNEDPGDRQGAAK